ncbi:MAG: hypothetical protein F4X47_16295 [Gammaproteobacteria bacterium]|nr:hypothetical protein [Gammaproteobacteria bacterium]MYC53868.1 hypothetical protein [Gammaproteobacteria bacterium]
MNRKADVPEGRDFFELVWHQEEECQTETDALLPNLGKKAPAAMTHIGTVMSLLDRMASCWWTCRGGDHRIEYLCGRAVNNARAAVRLLRFGLYDESLALSRAIGETANLMQLFTMDRSALHEWRNATHRQVRQDFSPYKVRKRLEGLSQSPVITQERYALLSGRATHVGPHTVPQSHNVLGLPFSHSQVQEEGILVCVNELATPLSVVAGLGAVLLDLDKDTRLSILNSARTLAIHIGGATITGIDEFHRRLRD